MQVYILLGQSNALNMQSAYAAELDARHGQDNYVLVTLADNGAPMTWSRAGLDWRSNNELRDLVAPAVEAAIEGVEDPQLAGIIWVQGEADTHAIARADEYAAALKSATEYIRQSLTETAIDLGGVAGAPVLITQLSDHAPASGGRAHWQHIQDQQAALADNPGYHLVNPDLVSATQGISTEQMFKDGLHYADGFETVLAAAVLDTLPATATNAQISPDRDDQFYINDLNDVIRHQDTGGFDQVFSMVDFSLRNHSQALEELYLLGSDNLQGTGNGRDNVIEGNAGDNRLNGAWGNDELIGGAGNDTFIDDHGADRMIGGTGDDLYYVDSRGDTIVEHRGGGHDSVITSVDFVLRHHSQRLEDLTLTGAHDINAIGNARDNVITGNSGDNWINGAWGNDTLNGGAGDDILTDDLGDDSFTGGSGADAFLFKTGHGDDVITDFDPGEDTLYLRGGTQGAAQFQTDERGTTLTWEGGTILLVDVFEAVQFETEFVF